MKPKICKNCNIEFIPRQLGQKVCSPKCAIEYAKAQRASDVGKECRKKRKQARDTDKAFQLKQAQAVFNRWIRLRDKDEPCISCQRHHNGQYHSGHYRSIGSAPHLRFNELNVHKQCSACNNHLSGNLVSYRYNLLNKIGEEKLDWLESEQTPKKYTLEEIKEIKRKYSQLIKEMP